MLRFLTRMVVLGLVLAGGAYALGYRWDGATLRGERAASAAAGAAAGALAGAVDRESIREAGAEIGTRIARGADRAESALAEARLTAKIKSKMALDDTLGDSRLEVDTVGSVVTVRGTAGTVAQHQRALQLARETAGVTSVVDRIEVDDR
jgi:osmotically-inducible protein OsmY